MIDFFNFFPIIKNMNILRKNILIPLVLFFYASGTIFASTSVKNINVIKNGNPADTMELFLIDGMGYVLTSDIAGIYKAKTNWYPASKKVILTVNGKEVVFRINSNRVIVDKIERFMKKPAKLKNGKLLIPLEFLLTRAFAEISNFYTEWDYSRLLLRVTTIPDIFPPRYYSYKDRTRVVIQAVEKKEIQLDSSKKEKILVKVYKSKIDSEKSSVAINDGVVNSIDAINLERDVMFVVNLGEYSGQYNTFTLSSPFRLVIDIERTSKTESSLPGFALGLAPSATGFIEKNVPSNILPPEKVKEDVRMPTDPQSKQGHKLKRVVIDAGHGGEDPGAIGPRGVKEKDINLLVAKSLASVLKKNGYEVFMTRSKDIFVPLADRTRFANKVMADLFVSIHCNASIAKRTSGFEIYFLSDKATDKAAEAVANMENSVIALEKHDANVKKDIEELLLSMAVNEFMNESSLICGVINQQICERVNSLKSRGVKQANFYVLRGASMPAVLVELAFLSNAKEEKLLRKSKFRKKMAESIARGIKIYEKKIAK
ncbi:MAG: N-acetylmuramoyl-L-alanine amidase [Elusimicrobia bacterium]|nr:N-acetylmuramoyl-L-alanine amidase [Elusimicrobiota bacterium]